MHARIPCLVFKNKVGELTSTSQVDRCINLIKCLQGFKSSMEFRNWESNADKVKLYESVRKGLAEIYEMNQRRLVLLQ